MPSNDTYVALRELKHGDSTYQAGEQVPFEGTEHMLPALIDGGYLASIPGIISPSASAEGEGVVSEEDALAMLQDSEDDEDHEDTDDEDVDGDAEPDTEPDTNEEPEVEAYDPGEPGRSVEDVIKHLEEHPEQTEAVMAAEAAGRGRKTLLAQLATMIEEADATEAEAGE